MKAVTLTWYLLRWPREVEPEQIAGAFRLLTVSAGAPVVVETVGTAGVAEHRVAVPVERAQVVADQLRAAIPGLALDKLERSAPALSGALELRLTTRRRPLRTDNLLAPGRALLTALTQVRGQEQLVLQWVLARSLPATPVPNRLQGLGPESWITALARAPFAGTQPADIEVRNALRLKQGEPGWCAIGRLAVRAKSAGRQQQLLRQVLGALRHSETPGIRWWTRSVSPSAVTDAKVSWRRPLRLNCQELAAISAWPVGLSRDLPVAAVGSQLVPPTRTIPRTGRVIGEASFPGAERPLALTPTDSLRHLQALGPSGSGKSTLLLNLITQDMAAGRAVVVIEPKGDLIADLLARVPEKRLDDVVLLDPTDRERPVGLNPLAPGGRSPELVADQLLGLFHSLYAAHWGPRTQDILGASLLTLARIPNMTLVALPLLLTDAGFRRRVVSQVVDPLGLGPFWRGFEAWSEPERTAAIAPVMNKLRPLLLRPEVRALIGQARPRFELRQVFTERKLLLVNLAAGALGPETAALLGSLVISQLWQAVLGRSAVPAAQRHPVSVVLDEFQTYLHLPVDLSDALAQARGYGVGFTLAHQYMHQLSSELRSGVMANVQSRIAFRLPNEDARQLAAGGALAPEDFQSLGAYECYAQLVADAAIQPWCSARTRPPSEPSSDAEAVRAASRERYGTAIEDIEAELHQLVLGPRRTPGDDLKPRLRQEKNS